MSDLAAAIEDVLVKRWELCQASPKYTAQVIAERLEHAGWCTELKGAYNLTSLPGEPAYRWREPSE